MKDTIYDHYIAIDWAVTNMTIARMTKKSNKITVIDVPADISDLQAYFKNLNRKRYWLSKKRQHPNGYMLNSMSM